MKLSKYNSLKQRLDTLQSESDRLQGALENNISKLKEDFDCSFEDAEDLLEELKQKKVSLESIIKKKIEEFEKKWEEFL